MKSTNAEWSTLKIVPDIAVLYLKDCHTKNRINKKIKNKWQQKGVHYVDIGVFTHLSYFHLFLFKIEFKIKKKTVERLQA